MKTMEDGDIFNFVVGGTAYVVATWWQLTLDSNRDESSITESTRFFRNTRRRILQRIQNNFKKNGVSFEYKCNEVSFIEQGYTFSIVHTSEFHSDIPKQLNLPLSI